MKSPLAIPFIVLWFVFVLINAVSFYRTHVKKKFTSAVPLMGGVFGLIGFYQIPLLRNWCWVALLLDYGSVDFLIALPKVAKELWQTNRINLVSELTSKESAKEVRIRLYKAGVFVIKHRIAREKGETGLVESSDMGSWCETDGTILLTLRNETAPLKQFGDAWRMERPFSHHAGDPNLDIQNIDFKQTL
jgi:hypothetical protein